jgi:hypothetical protein
VQLGLFGFAGTLLLLPRAILNSGTFQFKKEMPSLVRTAGQHIGVQVAPVEGPEIRNVLVFQVDTIDNFRKSEPGMNPGSTQRHYWIVPVCSVFVEGRLKVHVFPVNTTVSSVPSGCFKVKVSVSPSLVKAKFTSDVSSPGFRATFPNL